MLLFVGIYIIVEATTHLMLLVVLLLHLIVTILALVDHSTTQHGL